MLMRSSLVVPTKDLIMSRSPCSFLFLFLFFCFYFCNADLRILSNSVIGLIRDLLRVDERSTLSIPLKDERIFDFHLDSSIA